MTFYNQITAAFEKVFIGSQTCSLEICLLHELAKLFQAFGDGSNLSSIALKSAIVQQQLLLQKPSRSSKSKDHIRHLKGRLNLWQKGDIDILLHEGKSIQSRLKPKSGTSNAESSAHSFGKFMKEGKVKAALNLLYKAAQCLGS